MPHIHNSFFLSFPFPTFPPLGGDWCYFDAKCEALSSEIIPTRGALQGKGIVFKIFSVPFWGKYYKDSPKLVSFGVII